MRLFCLTSIAATMPHCPSCTGGAEGPGPGYATPLDAVRNGPRETLLYLPAIVPDKSRCAGGPPRACVCRPQCPQELQAPALYPKPSSQPRAGPLE